MKRERRRVHYPQLSKEALISGRNKSNAENRVWAKLVDASLIQICVWTTRQFFPTFGWIPALILWSCMDSFGRGQSPGKWLLGLHTIDTQKSRAPRLLNNFFRNFPFVLISINLAKEGLVPMFFLGSGVAMLAAEAYFVFTLRTGIRVGDILGNTRVFDYKDEHTKFIEQFLKKEEIS